ncbi:MAG: (2Fe-2S) ferredoxin domain-containing protein [Clostridia bacterium]|nr:(2Fe-2S) ferredoxin domain-containing protein [Clostridia bacterium]
MKSLAELQAIKEKMQNKVNLRAAEGDDTIRVVVGMATCGIAAGARPVLNAFLKEIEERRLNNVICTQTGCIGICQYEPVVEITTADGVKTTYVKMDEDKVAKVVTEHIVNNKVVQEYTIGAYQK